MKDITVVEEDDIVLKGTVTKPNATFTFTKDGKSLAIDNKRSFVSVEDKAVTLTIKSATLDDACKKLKATIVSSEESCVAAIKVNGLITIKL